MPTLLELWMPILLSGLAVFVLSFLMWMILPHHRSDWAPLPAEDAALAGLREVPPGQYMFPTCASAADRKDPAWGKTAEQGPAGTLVIRPRGPTKMGRAMGLSLLFNLCISMLTAYVASMALPHIASGLLVFRVTSVVSFLGYAGALGWNAIWMGQSWSSTWKSALDGVLYGLATGMMFVLFWPGI